MKELLRIFVTFCKVGALTFGGGYTMLPILQREVVEKRNWVSEEDVMDFYAVGQCLPGLIAVNTAGFIGNRIRGKAGGVAAALGVIFPSMIIIMIIAAFIQNFIEYPAVQRAFYGIRIAVAALVTDAIVKMWKKSMLDGFCILLFIAVFLLSALAGVSTMYLVLGAVACGILFQEYKRRGGSEK